MKTLRTPQSRKDLALDVLFDILGCLIFAVAVESLGVPYNLPPSGATGVAMLINYVTGFPISLGTFFVNVPLLLMAWKKLGREFALSTIRTVIIMTVCLHIATYVPVYDGDIMLASLFGGVLQGLGLALVLMRGSTTGGTDILSRLLQLRFPHISIGRMLFLVDAAILTAAAVVYQNVGNALYALIILFVSTQVIDTILFGLDSGRMMLIISDYNDDIAAAVHAELERGSTLLSGIGTYTSKERSVLVCAVPTREFYTVKHLVEEIDPQAFIMSVQTDEVFGEGFKPLQK